MERRPTRIEEILSTFEGLGPRLYEYRIFRLWEKVVGRKVSERAQPSGLKGATLYVTVFSSVWMQELSLFKGQIMERLNRDLGEERVQDIVFRLGRLRRKGRTSPEKGVLLPEETRRRIRELTRPVRDGELRQVLTRFLEKDAILKAKGRKGRQAPSL